MRLGVLDVGSNAVHLLICEPVNGVPLPVHRVKHRLRLAERLDATGRLDADSITGLVTAVGDATATADEWGVRDLFAYGTAVVRDAPNRAELLDAISEGAGLRLAVLPGEAEAALTFRAARRWMGHQAGPMAVLDIGGGSLEVAFGRGNGPDFTASLPLGAGRLTRELCGDQDPPRPSTVRMLRRHVRSEVADVAERIRWEGPRTAVGTSRTFQQLARLCGGPPGRLGPFARRALERTDLRRAVGELARLTSAQRARLPGISAARARQSVAGAVVAHVTMKAMGLDRVRVSPWALREGVLLRQIEDRDAGWWQDLSRALDDPDPAPVRLTAVGPGDTPMFAMRSVERPGGITAGSGEARGGDRSPR